AQVFLPGQDLFVGLARVERRVEHPRGDPPAVEDAAVHRAGVDVVEDRAGGRGAGFVEDPSKPQKAVERIAAPARKLTVAKIGGHLALSPRSVAVSSTQAASA